MAASFAATRSWLTCGPASIAQVISLCTARRAFAAWVVEIEPVPDSITLIMSIASAPRTSPTICRSARNRKLLVTCDAVVRCPAMLPSSLRSPEPARISQSNTTACWPSISGRNSSRSDSKVPTISIRGISAHNARTRVVLPAPWAPETTIDFRARTAARRKSAITSLSEPHSTRSASVTRRIRCRRITSDTRPVSREAASREPSARVRFSDGWAGVNERGLSALEATNAMKSTRSASLSATAGSWRIDPSAYSTTTRSHP